MKQVSNREIAQLLREMAALYEMQEEPFKPRAYEKAALNVESLAEDATALYDQGGRKRLEEIPGVGAGIAKKIEALMKKGRVKTYEKLQRQVPVKVEDLTAVEGVGPLTVKRLWDELEIKDLESLEKAAKDGKIRKLSGFGKKSEAKILQGIEFLRASGGRSVLGFVMPDLKRLERKVKELPGVERVAIAGSARRRKETIGDVDILAVTKEPRKVMKLFTELEEVEHVYSHGEAKSSVRLSGGLDVDLRLVAEESWGAALCYFTGSKAHNIALRKIAVSKNWKLNEYGLFEGDKRLAGEDEAEIYKKLGLAYVEPELREDRGEIEAAQKNKLPKLVDYNDLKGDLQIQTDWTDGRHSMEEMALEAEKMGLEYILITDHTRSLHMANGADEKKLRKQMEAIDKLNNKLRKDKKKIRVLKGAEVNILKDGTLDIDDEVLAELDAVGAAIHSYLELSTKQQTKRLIRAMENPNVDMIFHLTTRLINRRQPIKLDIDKIIETAKRTGTVLEVDAYPDRLDIDDALVRKCVEAGVPMVIDSDAHALQHYRYLEFGIGQARRGWAGRDDILNCQSLDKMLSGFKRANH